MRSAARAHEARLVGGRRAGTASTSATPFGPGSAKSYHTRGVIYTNGDLICQAGPLIGTPFLPSSMGLVSCLCGIGSLETQILYADQHGPLQYSAASLVFCFFVFFIHVFSFLFFFVSFLFLFL
jgi:hypothetical protein